MLERMSAGMTRLPRHGVPSRLAAWRERFRDPGLTGLLVLQVVVLFLLGPIAASGFSLPISLLVGVLLAAVSLVVAVSRTRGAVAIATASLIAGLLGMLLRGWHPSPLTEIASACGMMLAPSSLAWVVGKTVFAPGRITSHRIRGAVVL
jgi:hypothetical protein